MKRKLMSILLCTAMTATTVAGATTVLAEEEKKDAGEKEWEYKEAELTFLIDPDTASAGYQAVFDLCEEKQESILKQKSVHQEEMVTIR